MNETGGKFKTSKWWVALPIIGKIAKRAIDIIIILGLAAMAVMGTQIFQGAIDEMDPLIESGALPECVKTLPMGLAMVLLSGLMMIYWLHRRK